MQMNPWLKGFLRGASRFHTWMLRTVGTFGPGPFGTNILVLTTRGRRSGRESAIPLLYVAENGCLYVVASFGGNDEAPGWYKNLLAHPDVKVEQGGQARDYRARSLTAEEAKPIWPRLLAMYPTYAEYQTKTSREIPVVELRPA